MKQKTNLYVDETVSKFVGLSHLKEKIVKAVEMVCKCVANGGKILLCGNGGSSSDCEHIAGELLKEFYIKRPIDINEKAQLISEYGDIGKYIGDNIQGSIPAISLISQTGITSAFANDAAADLSYAQQVYGYADGGDILLGLSTSGNANNCYYAACVAKHKGANVIALTGKTGGKLKEIADVLLNVDAVETYLVQELHLPLYHLICKCVENEIFGD